MTFIKKALKTIVVISVLYGIVGYFAGHFGANMAVQDMKQNQKEEMDQGTRSVMLIQEAKKLTTLPMTIDDETTWVDIKYNSRNYGIQYIFVITLSKADVQSIGKLNLERLLLPGAEVNKQMTKVLDEIPVVEVLYHSKDTEELLFTIIRDRQNTKLEMNV